MIKKLSISTLIILSLFACVQTPANLKNENGEYQSRNGQIIIHRDAIAKDFFYPSLKYLADDLGAEITHSSKTRLSMKGKLPKGYLVSIRLEQRINNVCEIHIYSSKHGRPDDSLSEQVATELLTRLQ